jgi:D-tyrosyl-tRNA(Tyr) deacylase
MRALLQRVTHAQVEVDGEVVGSCERGYLILLGVATTDTEAEANKLWAKVSGLRVFDDEAGKMNLSLKDVDGEVLVVSQFTLYANARRGMRPAFVDAARPEVAVPLYEHFCEFAEADVRHVGRGIFGANMQVSLVNDGPVTIWLDTDELSRPGRHH